MIELRWLDPWDGLPDRLQYRVQAPFVDASGAVCGFGWQDWKDVPIVSEKDAEGNGDKLQDSQ